MTLDDKHAAVAAAVEARLGERAQRLENTAGELGYAIAPGDLLDCCRILRDTEGLQFEMLMDLCGVDYLSYGRAEWDTASATTTGFSRGVLGRGDALAETDYQPPSRFAVVYHLLSISNNARLRLKVACEDDGRPMVDSVTGIWASADWFEREAFDLFGILFVAHPDLRRILTDYGFIGHPFRKDFPLIGKAEVRYDPKKGRVVYEPVSIEPRTLVPKAIRDDNRYRPDLSKD
ncbi:MAG: NADH-quinone oxidoreductase subunit C [Proteobacteria bacterium]|nr:NADH-quinone oxidoreductase subunit C [Pseudomonadota bacterium]MYJ94091.1 NADH-quinone oxidoreductase subunit C [Pseudomonadota bacterium]